MDPFSIAISIASSVLANVLSRSLEEKRPQISRPEMREYIRAEVLQRHEERGEDFVKIIVKQVLQEIEVISTRHPDIHLDEEMMWTERPKKTIRRINKLKAVQSRIDQLKQIVDARRNELSALAQLERLEASRPEHIDQTGLRRQGAPMSSGEIVDAEILDEWINVEKQRDSEGYSAADNSISSPTSRPVRWVSNRRASGQVKSFSPDRLGKMLERIRRRKWGELE